MMATIGKTFPRAAALPIRSRKAKASAFFGEEVLLALDTLRKNPLRSALTILGIVIGITTVITVSAMINGLNDNVLAGIRELGSDTIIAYRFPWASLSRPPSEWFNRKELQPEWADDMEKLPHVLAASPSMRIFMPQFGSGTADVRRGQFRAKNVILQGNSPSIERIFDMKIQYGREFDENDTEHRAPVVMLGYDTARILFPDPSKSIGEEVTLNGQLFNVIGTMEKRKQGISGGANPEDNIAVMPVTTLRKLYPNKKDYVIFAKASDPKLVGEAVEETTAETAEQTVDHVPTDLEDTDQDDFEDGEEDTEDTDEFDEDSDDEDSEDEEEQKRIPTYMPSIVIVADEVAELIYTAPKEIEEHIVRLAQKARAVGMHLILAMATQLRATFRLVPKKVGATFELTFPYPKL